MPSMTALQGTVTSARARFASAITASWEPREHGRLNTPGHVRVAELTTATIYMPLAFRAIAKRAINGQRGRCAAGTAESVPRSVRANDVRQSSNRRLPERCSAESRVQYSAHLER